MNRLKSILLVTLVAIFAGSTVLISAPTSMAESAALSIAPRKNYTIEPGKVVEDTLSVKNIDKEQKLILNLSVIDFTFNDDTGAPKLLTDPNEPQKTWSLKPFIKLPDTVTIDPESSASIDFSISVPANQGAGSFYSAIRYSSSSADGGNVNLSASGVTLVFVNIPGKVKEDLTLEKLGAYRMPQTGSKGEYMRFMTEQPERIGYTLNNKGNVVESPTGRITLKDIFGRKTEIHEINPNGSLALIGQSRTFTACVKLKKEEINFSGTRTEAKSCATPGLWPGFYRVDMMAYYGQNGNNTEELSGQGWFWYMPWWFIALLLAVLLFAGYHIWRIVSYFRQKGSGGRSKKQMSRKR